MASLGKVLSSQGLHEEAEALLRVCLKYREGALPGGSWYTFDARSLLGASLAGQGRYAEAEPLLVHGYEGMRPPGDKTFHKRDALERVVALYEAWGKPEEAASWRRKLPGGNDR